MSRSTSSPRSSKKRYPSKQGFTLIATILVVSLLTVLIVSATVVSQIEEQAEYNASREEIARQNALFGLQQALNQLQTAAGPDQRVTARADILSPNNQYQPKSSLGYTSNNLGTDSGQGFWTGVWKNTLNDYAGPYVNKSISGNVNLPFAPNPFLYYDCLPNGSTNTTTSGSTPNRQTLYSPTNVTWLVSWPYSEIPTIPPDPTSNISSILPAPAANTYPSGVSTVAVAKNLSITNPLSSSVSSSTLNGQATTVSAPLVPINENAPLSGKSIRVGSYAYWVSDEGIKAKSDAPDPYISIAPTSSLPENSAHFASAQSPAVNRALAYSSEFPNSSSAIDVRGNSVIAPSLPSMSYADKTTTPSSWVDFANNPGTYSPDFTVSSYGVIADNFNGGLREDLTAAFENTSTYYALFGDLTGPNEALRKLYSVNSIVGTAYNSPIPNEVSSGSNNYVFDGLRWDSLFLYYNLYKQTMPSPISSAKGAAPTWVSGPPFTCNSVPTLTSRMYEEPGFCIDPISPQVVSYATNIGFQLVNAGANTYQVQLSDSPLMVLMNPFNVNLQAPATGNATNPYGGLNMDTNIGGMDSWMFEAYDPTGSTLLASTPAFEFGQSTGFMQMACGGQDSSGQAEPNLLPGELRAYGFAGPSTTVAYVGGATIGNSSVTWNPAAQAGTTYLQSKNIVGVNSPIQSVNPTGLTLSSSSPPLQGTDILKIKGGTRLRANNCYVQFVGYPEWPNSASVSKTNSAIYMNDINCPTVGTYNPGGQVQYGQIGSFIGQNQLVAAYFDRAYGYSSPNATNFTTFVPNPQNIPPTSAYGLNWLDVEASLINRDFSNSVANQKLSSSNSDFQVMSGASSMTDTGWGPNSVGSTTTNSQVPLKDIPRQPLQSLGQFRNMLCYYFPGFAAQQSLHFSFNPIGGSYEGGVGPNLTFAGLGGFSNDVVLDDNFLGNEALFDSYFLSTVPPTTAVNGSDVSSWPIPVNNSFSQLYINNGQALPNSRLVYYNRPNNPNRPSNSIAPNKTDLQGGTSSPLNLRLPAANLLIDGAFNINSTSVAAWEAQLSALSGPSTSANVNQYASMAVNPTNSQLTFSSSETPFFNFLSVVSSFASVPTVPNSSGARAAFFSLLRFNDTDIHTLAMQIVTQIQARGPALSLGDFLNRRLSATDASLSTSGVLQSAIDGTATLNSGVTGSMAASVPSSINTSSTAYTIPVAGTINYPYVPPTNPTNFTTAACVPGTLSQYDLVQALAPIISARSDTFTIRAYGDSVNPSTGAIEGKAWCEVIVQRFPEYEYSTEAGIQTSTSASDYAYDNPAGLIPANYALGRRFKILSIRWLNPNEL